MGSCWYKGGKENDKKEGVRPRQEKHTMEINPPRDTGAQALDKITMAQSSQEQTQCSSTEHLKHPKIPEVHPNKVFQPGMITVWPGMTEM